MDDPGLVERLQPGGDVLGVPGGVGELERPVVEHARRASSRRCTCDARKRRPSACPASSTGTRCGSVTSAAARASCSKRRPKTGILDQLEAHHLERDDRAVRLARRLEDEAHAALAEQLVEPVRPEGVAGLELAARGFAHERHPQEDMFTRRVRANGHRTPVVGSAQRGGDGAARRTRGSSATYATSTTRFTTRSRA